MSGNAELDRRISNIENGEYKSATRLYENAQSTLKLISTVFGALTGLIVLLTGYNIYDQRTRFVEFVNESQSKIDEITGQIEFTGYTIAPSNESSIVKYYLTGFSNSNTGLSESAFSAIFQGYMNIRATGQNEGRVEQYHIQLSEVDFPTEIYRTELERERQELSLRRVFTKSEKFFLSRKPGISISSTVRLNIPNCERFNRFKAWLSGEPAGRLTFTPVVANKAEAPQQTTLDFVFVEGIPLDECPLISPEADDD
jgi:hypothetical protein